MAHARHLIRIAHHKAQGRLFQQICWRGLMWRIKLGSGIGRQIHPVAQRQFGQCLHQRRQVFEDFHAFRAFRVFCAFRAQGLDCASYVDARTVSLRAGQWFTGTRTPYQAQRWSDRVPAALYQLAETLEILDLSGNQLTTLPEELTRFARLRILFASNNPFSELPRVLGRMPQLEMVGFKACRIAHVPEDSLPARCAG
jgi:hypothetical protein